MNRFKKYVRNKGIKLENDYPWLPYETKHNITLEGIFVSSSTATLIYFYNVGTFHQHFNTDGTIEYS